MNLKDNLHSSITLILVDLNNFVKFQQFYVKGFVGFCGVFLCEWRLLKVVTSIADDMLCF